MEHDSILKKSFGDRLLEMMARLRSKKQLSQDERYRTTLMNLDDYLAQPEEDRKIGSKLKLLQNFIDSHAKYYHDKPVGLSKEEILALLEKKLFTSDREATWRLAYDLHHFTSHRETFIRIIISKAIALGIDFYGNPDISLLPQEIVLFMTAFKETPRLKDTSQVDDVALCEWRRLGMFLLSDPNTKTIQLRNSGLRIDAMLNSLDEILSPFAEPIHTGEGSGRRLDNLRRLLEIGAEFGVLLFGQPCGWELNWAVRPSDETQREYKALNNGLAQSSDTSELVTNTGNAQYPPLHNGSEPEPDPPKRRRRKRLGRSQSMKEKKSREQPQGKYYPPSAWRSQNFDTTVEEKSGATLQRTITGGSDNQHLHQHRLHPSNPHYNQSLSLRSQSESDFSPAPYQDWGLPGSKHNVSTAQNEMGTNDPNYRKDEIKDKPPPTLPKDVHAIEPQLNEPPLRFQERPGTRSGETQQEASFLDGPEETRFKPDLASAPPRTQIAKPMTYFPALLKTRDEYGCKLSQHIVVSEPVVDRSFLTYYYS